MSEELFRSPRRKNKTADRNGTTAKVPSQASQGWGPHRIVSSPTAKSVPLDAKERRLWR